MLLAQACCLCCVGLTGILIRGLTRHGCAGITWVLSDEVVHMSDAAWQQRYLHLRGIRQQTGLARVDSLAHSEALYDWLEHQKALGVLGTALHSPCSTGMQAAPALMCADEVMCLYCRPWVCAVKSQS